MEILDVGEGEPGRDLWKIAGDERGLIGLGLRGVARAHVQRDAKTPRFFKQEAAADRPGYGPDGPMSVEIRLAQVEPAETESVVAV
ncbi:hypothetical protein [Methylobacterium tardum]|uniref:Uncharacterized protein n=1 Tax=Methylobacterium tardum TaxID=374432 RepID=A0AA37TIY3_9HYPH|nr:hypothetical protein [Methylobacterium tardum]URD37501.1 hypothetical protein M6G65_02700 [Methylobacterium tardum]GLS70606.1 hypothetical protein GCM10007890_26190 [Methylobacterium tardum]